jgi:hypothetical protein
MDGGWSWARARTAAQRVYEEYYAGIGSAAQGGSVGHVGDAGHAGLADATSTSP